MPRTEDKYIVALDIGTSKVCVLVGEINDRGQLEIIGKGTSPMKGTRRGNIINLIGNATKYSGENTFIEFNTEINEKELIVTIKDNGIGIPESDQKHLFEAFFRAHNTGNIPGTGLGLNIVTRYVALMNGTIRFESQVNQGTSFTLSFPL